MIYKFMRFPQGKAKALTLSYDDAREYDLHLLEIIHKYGLKCTFNVNSDIIVQNKGKGTLSEETLISSLKNSPHEVAVHGARHIAPGLGHTPLVIEDILSCRKWLEEKFEKIVRGMAYPDSGITRFVRGSAPYEDLRTVLKGLGIAYARTLRADNNRFELPSDWYAWLPTAHHDNPNLFAWLDEFLSLDLKTRYRAEHYPRLFYVWGHSYEFENNKNWDRLETFCRKVAEKKDEVWIATNGEIHDYATAYESLIWNAEGTRVFNPTLIEVFFAVDGVPYSVKSGETLTL